MIATCAACHQLILGPPSNDLSAVGQARSFKSLGDLATVHLIEHHPELAGHAVGVGAMLTTLTARAPASG